MPVLDVTDDTFAAEVLQSDQPVLVDYWADWCTPCKQIAPIVSELADEYGDRMRFVKVDTNANPKTAADYGVLGLPTLQIFQGGEVVKSVTGGKTKSALVKLISEYL